MALQLNLFKTQKHAFLIVVLVFSFIHCNKMTSSLPEPDSPRSTDQLPGEEDTTPPTPNLLFVLADDLGIDAMPG